MSTEHSTEKHYFVEHRPDGKFAVLARNAERASGLFDTQAEAEAAAHKFNSEDHADVARVRTTETGHPDQWRKA